jgi:hypothetical protein
MISASAGVSFKVFRGNWLVRMVSGFPAVVMSPYSNG